MEKQTWENPQNFIGQNAERSTIPTSTGFDKVGGLI